MSPALLLTVYCLLIVAASILGGLLPIVVRLTHRRMEIALSFVSGVMLGIAILHLLPHALAERSMIDGIVVESAIDGDGHGHDHAHGAGGLASTVDPVMGWMLAGFLVIFLLERALPFHHHPSPEEADAGAPCGPAGGGAGGGHDHHDHRPPHDLTWTGAIVGLTIHSLIAGLALAASVHAEWGPAGGALAGLGTFLVIVLHKPFDAITVLTLLAVGGRSRGLCHVVNGLFGLTIPVAVILFHLGISTGGAMPHAIVSAALAFSAGTFLCIALSDLLPELQFHRHDRVKLSLALVLGLAVAWAVAMLEGGAPG